MSAFAEYGTSAEHIAAMRHRFAAWRASLLGQESASGS